MPSDPDTVLDALAAGLSIPAAARFGLTEEVRALRKAEADRLADGEEIRQAYALARPKAFENGVGRVKHATAFLTPLAPRLHNLK
jgi:hypothetical protein